jgi:hypothetical protein
MTVLGSGNSIADSRPAASNDPVEGSSDPILVVNFRAGNNPDCLEINQYRENGERTLTDTAIQRKRELAASCTTNRFAA